MTRSTCLLGLAFSWTLFLANVGSAQLPRVPTSSGPRMQGPPTALGVESVKDWSGRLHRIDEDLKAGKWGKARKASDLLLVDMLERMEIGDATGPTLALVLTFRALGASGEKDLEAARWDWLAAQAIQPDLREAAFLPYGDAGPPLEGYRRRDDGVIPAAAPLLALTANAAERPAAQRDGKPPRYPDALRPECARGEVKFPVIVDDGGRAIFPLGVAAKTDPAMAVAAFEVVRGWRFEPARRSGKASASLFEVVLSFDPGRCRPRAAP